jgi:hypothetical protein
MNVWPKISPARVNERNSMIGSCAASLLMLAGCVDQSKGAAERMPTSIFSTIRGPR